jgi:hypothetical protein
MDGGAAALKYTFWGFLMAGISSLTLFFLRKGREREAIIRPGECRPAFRCGSCGGFFVAPVGTPVPPDSNATHRCGRCGVRLEPGRLDCHWCGWGKTRCHKIVRPSDTPYD